MKGGLKIRSQRDKKSLFVTNNSSKDTNSDRTRLLKLFSHPAVVAYMALQLRKKTRAN
jgi:hypothetical protein